MKLSDIKTLEIIDCYGVELTVRIAPCPCPCLTPCEPRCISVVDSNNNHLMHLDTLLELGEEGRDERSSRGEKCRGNWPWILEQLAAERIIT